ncbi:MAG: Chemotaxis response regulator protein-glutamate methylesterase [Gemmatimonadetes bacterium]|nr:Chemotaxis response regulator protein-glutamate methylesterase [Gemmatimonadota bacterium]
MAGLIRVLVVDDSAFVRKVVTQMLGRSPFIEVVGAARDGGEALEMVTELAPDVVTLDLVMPRMDGIEFLERQMAVKPVAVVVCSITQQSGAAALQALDLGAVDFIQKPTALATDRVYEIAEELIAKVKSAAEVSLPLAASIAATPRPKRASPALEVTPRSAGGPLRSDIVVLGISTGGPQALRLVIPQIPVDFPVPIAVVLHMPVGYTEMYAQRLNDISAITVVEAHAGDEIRPRTMYLAPAGQHLSFVRAAGGAVQAHLDLEPHDTQHRPAVDVLFRSAANVYGNRVLGVVMTGMGSDGLFGSAHIQAKGGRILTEAESSCVVYGMPRAVVEAGMSNRAATLGDMASSILDMI